MLSDRSRRPENIFTNFVLKKKKFKNEIGTVCMICCFVQMNMGGKNRVLND